MWELDHKEGWALKNWCFWTVVLEKTLESSLDSKKIKPVSPKGNQPWILTGRIDAETEAPVLWPPDVKSWLIGKDPDTGKDGRQEEKGMTEDETVGWYHGFSGHEFQPNSRRFWRTGKPRDPPFMGSQRVGQDRVTEQQQCIKQMASGTNCPAQGTLLNSLWSLNVKEIPKRGDIHVHTVDSLCYIAETNTTL